MCILLIIINYKNIVNYLLFLIISICEQLNSEKNRKMKFCLNAHFL